MGRNGVGGRSCVERGDATGLVDDVLLDDDTLQQYTIVINVRVMYNAYDALRPAILALNALNRSVNCLFSLSLGVLCINKNIIE